MTPEEKYAEYPQWLEPCGICGNKVLMCPATWEVKGPYHDGCFGWPMCSCKESHKGNCPPGPTEKQTAVACAEWLEGNEP